MDVRVLRFPADGPAAYWRGVHGTVWAASGRRCYQEW